MTATTGSAEVLADRIKTNPLGWLPGVGDCINITFTPEEAQILVAALLAAKPAEDVREAIIALVETSMRDAWNDICSDTDCHPLDIVHGRGKVLSFEPMHWARFTGEAVADALSTTGQPKPLTDDICTNGQDKLVRFFNFVVCPAIAACVMWWLR